MADFWDGLGRKLSDAADVVSKKTGEGAEIAKLKNQIYTQEREMEKNFAEIGKKIYAQYLETQVVDGEFQELCETIARQEILIDQYKGEIEARKENK